MRKVLSLVLILALVLGSFSMAFAADVEVEEIYISDIDGIAAEGAINVLIALGIVQGYPDGTYKPDQVVTRAEAAKMIIVALGLEDSVGTQKSGFPDMAGYGWAEGYVAYASQLGIITGYPDGTFAPGKTVSYDEFVTIVVKALGYRDSVLAGTWPANYANQGTALGLFDSIISGGSNGMNRADVATMLYNGLACEIGAIGADGKWVATVKKYATDEADAVYDTMLYRNDAASWTGVVNDADAEDSIVNLRGNIGERWQAFFLDKESLDYPTIALKSHKATTLQGKWNSEDDVNDIWKSGGVKYVYTVDEDAYTEYFFNGEAAAEDRLVAALDPDAATDIKIMEAKVSGKTIKYVYSVSAWEPNAQVIVEAGDLEDLEDGELLGYEFDLAKDDSIIANSFDLVGVASLEDIKGDNVVYIYVGETSDKIRKIAVGTEIVEGKITKVNEEDDEWTINGTVYAFNNGAETGFDNDLLGDTVKVWLDAYGDIYDYEITSGSAENYAIVKAVTKHDAGNVDEGEMKLFLADESTKKFDSDLGDDLALVEAGSLIGYSLDKDGVVDAIFPDSEDDPAEDYVTVAATATLASKRVLKIADGTPEGVGQVVIDSDVVVFTVDEDGDYAVTDIANITDDPMEDVMYLVRDGEIVAMLIDEEYATGKDEIYAVFNENTNGTNWKKAYNNVDEKAFELGGFINGVKTATIFTSDDSDSKLDELEKATAAAAYKVKIDADGNISDLEYLNDAEGFYSFEYTGDPVNSGTYKNYIKDNTNGGVYAIAEDAQFYEYDDGDYSKYNGRIEDGAMVYIFDADDDVSAYEIVIIERP